MSGQVWRLPPGLLNQHLLLMGATEVTQHRSTIQIDAFLSSDFGGATEYGLLRGETFLLGMMGIDPGSGPKAFVSCWIHHLWDKRLSMHLLLLAQAYLGWTRFDIEWGRLGLAIDKSVQDSWLLLLLRVIDLVHRKRSSLVLRSLLGWDQIILVARGW